MLHTTSMGSPLSVAAPADARVPGLLRGAFVFLGFIAPLLLVIAAFWVSPDIAVRTGIIIEGCGLIVAALAATTFIAVLYRPAAPARERTTERRDAPLPA